VTRLAGSPRSIRTHILAMVVCGAILPLAIIGTWLTQSGVRSGRQLLRDQVTASVQSIADAAAMKWTYRRGELLLLAGNTSAARIAAGATPTTEDLEYLARLHHDLLSVAPLFAYQDVLGRVRWTTASIPDPLQLAGRAPPPAPFTRIDLPVLDAANRIVGSVAVNVALASLVTTDSGKLSVPGAVLVVRDTLGNTLFSSGPTPSAVDGPQWFTAHRRLTDPLIDLAVSAPTGAYVTTFERAARVGVIALLLVSAIAFALTMYITARITSPLDHLVVASSAVAHGSLAIRVEERGPREVRALGRSFNEMTNSLQRTMDELSRRSALAAVGEFAASMAHEVRNALTSVQVDLQRAEEKLEADSVGRELVLRSLVTVTRLDGTVTGALRIARTGSAAQVPVNLYGVIDVAASRASHAFAAAGAKLSIEFPLAIRGLAVNGDRGALEQLFVNLLVNAAQAVAPGGGATVHVEQAPDAVVVSVRDDGAGMRPEDLDRAFEPFFTTRAGGTGLGLAISRQIAVAHGGDLSIVSEVGRGTTVGLRLPIAPQGATSVQSGP
jgi:signal transduction histidine kinase